MTSEVVPVFRSVEHALAFAFKHPHGQIERPLSNRMADKTGHNGHGLSGLDGAGQAGIILGKLQSLGDFAYSLAAARYLPHTMECHCGAPCCTGWRQAPEWRQAIDTIAAEATHLLPHRRPMLMVRRAVVLRYFGEKANFSEIAKTCRVDRDTVSHHANIVKGFIRASEHRMRAEMADSLKLAIDW